MEWRSVYLGDLSSSKLIVVIFTDEENIISVTYSKKGKLLEIVLEYSEQ
jgi:hypothetical protein